MPLVRSCFVHSCLLLVSIRVWRLSACLKATTVQPPGYVYFRQIASSSSVVSSQTCNHSNISHFSSIEPSQIVWTARRGSNDVVQGLEFDVVSCLTISEWLQGVVWCVLKDVKRIWKSNRSVINCHNGSRVLTVPVTSK